MLIQCKKGSGPKNESVRLLDNEGGFQRQKLSDDCCDKPVKSWDAHWLNRRSLACSDRKSNYSDLNEKKDKGTSRRKKNRALVNPLASPSDQNCLRIDGLRAPKSCLSVPGFMKTSSTTSTSSSTKEDSESSTIAPPPPQTSSTPKKLPPIYSSEVKDEVLLESPESIMSDVRYSLRTSIGDGSVKQLIQAERELRPNGVRINVSHYSDMGLRPYMEDRYVVENMGAVQAELSSEPTELISEDGSVTSQATRRLAKLPLTWVGVFDGHGGDKASQFCADWLSSYVKNQQTYPHDLGYAMKNAFNNIDQEFCLTGHADGTTACTASIVGGRRIICANAGDSRAIIIRKDGSVLRITRDHKPGLPDESQRIAKLGGRVIYWQKRWRVEGLLAVSRGIGDAPLKPYVSADPEVCEYDVCNEDLFLVMSSDGVWDVMSNEEVAHIVMASSCVRNGDEGSLTIDTERFKWAARNLCQHAKSKGSTDNFSAICVDLQSCGNPMSTSATYETR